MTFSPGLKAAHLIDRLERISRTAEGGPPLNAVQWQVLRYLLRANRFSKTPAALADFLASTRGTVSQTLITLEERGLVHKTASARDRRVVNLELTAAGQDALEFDPLILLGRDLAKAAGQGVEDLVFHSRGDAQIAGTAARRANVRGLLHLRALST